jgi:hypothetical protein
MRATILALGATALMLAPAIVIAQTAPGNGQNNGKGYWHTNGPASTGQPGADCEEIVANGGSTPGNSSSAPGSAFNPDGRAGTRYAGEQPQNSRNTASVSQYDVACANQPG